MRRLKAEYPGRVFLVWYRRDKKGQEMIRWGTDDEYGSVIADRNRLIQLLIDEMLDRRVTFNGTESEWQDYITHWMNIYRIWVPMAGEDETTGKKEFKWERSGPDHWVHCSVYCRIGLDRFQNTMAKIFGIKESFPKAMIVADEGVRARDIPSPEIQQAVILNWDAPYEGR